MERFIWEKSKGIWPENSKALGIDDTTIRLSVGIENQENQGKDLDLEISKVYLNSIL